MSHPVITVWAPTAEAVELQWSADGGPVERDPMVRDDDGWWRWDGDPTAYEAFDYAFVLDGAEPALPDPRSAWQPSTVHGPSRFVDTARFTWTDRDWRGTRGGAGCLGGIIYELHIGTFTPEGTFAAAIDRLDDLVALGVDLVEVMPVAAFPGDWGWGYDGVALYAVHDRYGGPLAFQRFVDAAHAKGLGVCLDVVHNHLGPSGNYLSRFGPYFTDTHHTPWGSAVNLDAPGAAGTRAFLVEQALRWFREFHVDALRLDAVHELKDDSERHFLAELSDATAALADELGRPLDLIAESDLNDVTMVRPTAQGGLGMTAQWNDDIHHALHVALTGETHGYYADFAGGTATMPDGGALAVLATVLEGGFLHAGRFSTFRGREWGVPIDRESFDARRVLAYLQTHDQVGNRATGDRINHALTPGQHAIGAALMLLGPATPMLFMGEEWCASTPFAFFTSFDEGALAQAIRDGRRAEFADHGWDGAEVPDPQDPRTRDDSVLLWDEATDGDHAALQKWYAALIRLRHSTFGGGETRFADVSVAYDEEQRWFVMRHRDLVVAANLGDESVTIAPVPASAMPASAVPASGVPASPMPATAVPVLTWGADDGGRADGIPAGLADDGTIALRAHDCIVLHVPRG